MSSYLSFTKNLNKKNMAPAGTNQDLYNYVQLVYDNNGKDLISALQDNGINIGTLSRDSALTYLYNLSVSNPDFIMPILKSIKYDPSAPNYTTSPAFQQQIVEYLAKNGITYAPTPASAASKTLPDVYGVPQSSLPSWIGDLGTVIGGGGDSTTVTQTSTPTAGSNSTTIIVVVVIAAMAAAAIFIIFKNK